MTDLRFKVTEETIIILKGLPVWQCANCQEYLIEDAVMARVEPQSWRWYALARELDPADVACWSMAVVRQMAKVERPTAECLPELGRDG